ncbi:MAG: biotin transporter BioY [Clostridiales bacterium]|nr:biotin transporter BioY [Clostridiales bacterium]
MEKQKTKKVNESIVNKDMVNKGSVISSERVKMLVLTGMFTAMLSIMAQIVIPIQPIPFSLSLFAIFLTGALLPPRYAFLSILSYILLGAFGVPVFAGFKGGFHVLTNMTGGYIASYPLMGLITSYSYKITSKRKTLFLTIGMVLSLLVCYALGTLWFTYVSGTGFIKALSICVIPFVPFDLLKLILAVTVSSIIRKTIR